MPYEEVGRTLLGGVIVRSPEGITSTVPPRAWEAMQKGELESPQSVVSPGWTPIVPSPTIEVIPTEKLIAPAPTVPTIEEKIYKKATMLEKAGLHIATLFSPKGYEYIGSILPGGETPTEVVKERIEQLAEESRKKVVIESVLFSPPVEISTLALGGAGATKIAATRIGGKILSSGIGKVALGGMTALYVGGRGLEIKSLVERGEKEEAIGKGLVTVVGLGAGFASARAEAGYIAGKMPKMEILALAREEIGVSPSRFMGESWITKGPKTQKFFDIFGKREFIEPFKKGKITEEFGQFQIREFERGGITTKLLVSKQPTGLPSQKMGELVDVKGISVSYKGLLEPGLKIGVERAGYIPIDITTPREKPPGTIMMRGWLEARTRRPTELYPAIEMGKMEPGLRPIIMENRIGKGFASLSIGMQTMPKGRLAGEEFFEFKSIEILEKRKRELIVPSKLTLPSMKIGISERLGEGIGTISEVMMGEKLGLREQLGLKEKMVASLGLARSVSISASSYFYIPPITVPFLGGGGGYRARRRKRPSRRTYYYTPTLFGVETGRKIRKSPKEVGIQAIGIRYPLAPKGKGNLLSGIFSGLNPFKSSPRHRQNKKTKKRYEKNFLGRLGI